MAVYASTGPESTCFALHSDTRIAVVPVTCPHSLHGLRPGYVTGALSGTTAPHHSG